MGRARVVDAGRMTRAARLSLPGSFWALAAAFTVTTALATAPSGLYGLYERDAGYDVTTVTVVYAAYAIGTVASLLLVGHVSDWYGRKTVLLPAIGLAVLASVILWSSTSLALVLVARVLTGVALGATVSTATAALTDIDAALRGPTARAGLVATLANLGGLALGPLIVGLLAAYAPAPLKLPYAVLGTLLVVGLLAVAAIPEPRPPIVPRPRYRPQALRAPNARSAAAMGGVVLSFAAYGLFAGLAGTVLADVLHHDSPALAGTVTFVVYGAGAATQIAVRTWRLNTLLVTGPLVTVAGLVVTSTAVWLAPPSLALFLLGGAMVGVGGGAIFRASIVVVLEEATADDRAASVATFYAAGFCGLSVPVVGLGVALQYLSVRTTLLAFAAFVAAGLLAATPALLHDESQAGVSAR